MDKTLEVCSECGKKLIPGEKLLAAIIGEIEDPLCQSCSEEVNSTRCIECQKPTSITVNSKPYCPQHAGELNQEEP